ncbi:uncharacterized protein LOC134527809 [Bacillus rossius redtenbacheri]|uniref:uncharacterized protein LOC134527809 n=1 Tax=Bacillus rossius redtenbacheri TaxID=93214 RepID=UPI002FDD2FE7
MAARYNCMTIQHWTVKDLRQKWESLKREARKDAAMHRQALHKTGGGPSVEIKVNPAVEQVKEILQLSADGMESVFDRDRISDAAPVPAPEQENMPAVKVVCMGPDVTEVDGKEISCEMVEMLDIDIDDRETYAQEMFETVPGGSSDWSSYKSAMLKSAKNKKLKRKIAAVM